MIKRQFISGKGLKGEYTVNKPSGEEFNFGLALPKMTIYDGTLEVTASTTLISIGLIISNGASVQKPYLPLGIGGGTKGTYTIPSGTILDFIGVQALATYIKLTINNAELVD